MGMCLIIMYEEVEKMVRQERIFVLEKFKNGNSGNRTYHIRIAFPTGISHTIRVDKSTFERTLVGK